MQKSGPSKAVFCKFSYKRLVLCSIADLLGVWDSRNQAVMGVKFLHFQSKSLACSNQFSFLLYSVKGFFGISDVPLLMPHRVSDRLIASNAIFDRLCLRFSVFAARRLGAVGT